MEELPSVAHFKELLQEQLTTDEASSAQHKLMCSSKLLARDDVHVLLLKGTVDGNKVVSVLGAVLLFGRQQERIACIEVVYVVQAWRRHGIASAMLAEVLKMSLAHAACVGQPMARNQAAFPFWKVFGFALDGRYLNLDTIVPSAEMHVVCAGVAARSLKVTVLSKLTQLAKPSPVVLRSLSSCALLGLHDKIKVHRRAIEPTLMFMLMSRVQDDNSEVILDAGHPHDFGRATIRLPGEWHDLRAPQLQPLRALLHDVNDVARNGSVLVSVPGGKVQSWHLDFDPIAVHREMQAGGRMPYTILLCLSPSGKLFFQGSRNTVLCVNMNAGDVVLFSGDVWHAGAAYHCKHYRAHWYIHAPLRASRDIMPSSLQIYNKRDECVCASNVGEVTHVFNVS